MSSRTRARSATPPTSVTSVCSAAIRASSAPVGAVPLQVVQVGDLVDEDVGPLGEGDQVVVHGGVAGEHDGAVRGVEPVGQRRNRPAVRHGHGGDPDRVIVEDDDRDRRRPRPAGTAMSKARTSAPASGMRASSGMTFRW